MTASCKRYITDFIFSCSKIWSYETIIASERYLSRHLFSELIDLIFKLSPYKNQNVTKKIKGLQATLRMLVTGPWFSTQPVKGSLKESILVPVLALSNYLTKHLLTFISRRNVTNSALHKWLQGSVQKGPNSRCYEEGSHSHGLEERFYIKWKSRASLWAVFNGARLQFEKRSSSCICMLEPKVSISVKCYVSRQSVSVIKKRWVGKLNWTIFSCAYR